VIRIENGDPTGRESRRGEIIIRKERSDRHKEIWQLAAGRERVAERDRVAALLGLRGVLTELIIKELDFRSGNTKHEQRIHRVIKGAVAAQRVVPGSPLDHDAVEFVDLIQRGKSQSGLLRQ